MGHAFAHGEVPDQVAHAWSNLPVAVIATRCVETIRQLPSGAACTNVVGILWRGSKVNPAMRAILNLTWGYASKAMMCTPCLVWRPRCLTTRKHHEGCADVLVLEGRFGCVVNVLCLLLSLLLLLVLLLLLWVFLPLPLLLWLLLSLLYSLVRSSCDLATGRPQGDMRKQVRSGL